MRGAACKLPAAGAWASCLAAAVFAAVAVHALGGPARADDYPTRPVTILVPLGASDAEAVARLFASQD